jgi:hypothetical protein
MATKAQIAANRRNAKKSTGPKTPEGKAASCMNALRHGLRAEKAVLPNENEEEYAKIHLGLQDLYQPQTIPEQDLVDQAVLAKWKLVRAEVFEAKCYDTTSDPNDHAAILNRMTQVQGRLERSYFKAYKELERIKAARAKPAADPPSAEPPSAEPPATEPPATEPPATEPPKERIIRLQTTWANPVNGIDSDLFRDRTLEKLAKSG